MITELAASEIAPYIKTSKYYTVPHFESLYTYDLVTIAELLSELIIFPDPLALDMLRRKFPLKIYPGDRLNVPRKAKVDELQDSESRTLLVPFERSINYRELLDFAGVTLDGITSLIMTLKGLLVINMAEMQQSKLKDLVRTECVRCTVLISFPVCDCHFRSSALCLILNSHASESSLQRMMVHALRFGSDTGLLTNRDPFIEYRGADSKIQSIVKPSQAKPGELT